MDLTARLCEIRSYSECVLEPQTARFSVTSDSRIPYGIPEHAIAVGKIAGVRAPEDMTAPDHFPLERQACSATKVVELPARIALINDDPKLRCFLIDGIKFASNLAQAVRWALCAVRKQVITLYKLKGIGIDFSEDLLEAL